MQAETQPTGDPLFDLRTELTAAHARELSSQHNGKRMSHDPTSPADEVRSGDSAKRGSPQELHSEEQRFLLRDSQRPSRYLAGTLSMLLLIPLGLLASYGLL